MENTLKLTKMHYWLIAVGAIIAFGGFTMLVLANPLFMGIMSHTGTTTLPNIATSTYALATLRDGQGTTTLVYDAFHLSGTNQTQAGSTQIPDQLTLNVQLFASSTRTQIRIAIEQSRDGIDWYSLARPVNELATSTVVAAFSGYQFHFASTTGYHYDLAQVRRDFNRFYINIKPDMRFIRTVIWMPSDSMPGMIYAELVPTKQRPE